MPLKHRFFTYFLLPAFTLFALSPAYATLFSYYTVGASAQPTPPPVKLLETDTPLTCTSLARTRNAITYTDFEVYPVPGWASYWGTWSFSEQGFKGGALQGTDTYSRKRQGWASHYYYNSRLDSYASLWVSVKTRLVSGYGWYGISMMNPGRNRLYAVEIQFDGTSGWIEVRSFHVEATNDWYLLGRSAISQYNPTGWYTIVVNYHVTAASVDFYVWVYDESGAQIAAVTARSTDRNRFTPAYIGVVVDGVTALFDDFIISTVDPRNINVTGLPDAGYRVEIVDNLGYLVASATSPGSTVSVSVVHDIVVGTGVDGRINIYGPGGYLYLSYTAPDSILGGDVYTITYYAGTSTILGPNSTSASVSVPIFCSPNNASYALRAWNVDAKSYYVRLVLDIPSSSISPALTLNVTLAYSPSGYVSPPIRVVGGSVVSSATGWGVVEPGQVLYVYLSGYHSVSGASSKLRVYLQYCTLPGEGGACAYYPIELEVKS